MCVFGCVWGGGNGSKHITLPQASEGKNTHASMEEMKYKQKKCITDKN